MPSRRLTSFVPKWAREAPGELLADTPTTGEQPEFAPRLPIRLLPHDDGHRVSALTLSQAISTTQRILNYASYEVVHGSVPEFSDLKSAEGEVIELARLEIEAFEEGSFLIPARLDEREVTIDQRSFSAPQVLGRFVEVMDSVAAGQPTSISIGLIQAIEDLGRITRREAAIEFSPSGFRGAERRARAIYVDNQFISHVSRAKLSRRATHTKPDEIEGTVTAVDMDTFKFSLRIAPKTVVKGSYETIVADKMANSLGERVKVYGVVEYVGGMPNHIRAFALDSLD